MRTIILTGLAAILVAACSVAQGQNVKHLEGTLKKSQLLLQLREALDLRIQDTEQDVKHLQTAIADATPKAKLKRKRRVGNKADNPPEEKPRAEYEGPLRGGLEAPLAFEDVPTAQIALKYALQDLTTLKSLPLVSPDIIIRECWPAGVGYLKVRGPNRELKLLILTVESVEEASPDDPERTIHAKARDGLNVYIEYQGNIDLQAGDKLEIDNPVLVRTIGLGPRPNGISAGLLDRIIIQLYRR